MSGHIRAASGLSQAARVPFDHQYSWKDFLSYGCSFPLVAPAFGGVRIAYGSLMISQGLIESINLYAKKRLSFKDFPANIPDGYVSGPGMMLLQGAQHILSGVVALNYWYLGLVSIVFEKVFKKQIPTLFTASPMMDPLAISELLSRLKQHSLYKRLETSLNELKRLAFEAPQVEEALDPEVGVHAASLVDSERKEDKDPALGEPFHPHQTPFSSATLVQTVTTVVGGFFETWTNGVGKSVATT